MGTNLKGIPSRKHENRYLRVATIDGDLIDPLLADYLERIGNDLQPKSAPTPPQLLRKHWLLSFLIEGFAIAGAAMYPSYEYHEWLNSSVNLPDLRETGDSA